MKEIRLNLKEWEAKLIDCNKREKIVLQQGRSKMWARQQGPQRKVTDKDRDPEGRGDKDAGQHNFGRTRNGKEAIA